MINENNTKILCIDIQEKLVNMLKCSTEIASNAYKILKAAAILNVDTFLTEQYPKGLGATVETLREALPENTQYFEKTAFSALENNDVLEALKNSGKKQVVIFGIETHICVSQTTNALIQDGFEVSVIRDACGSRSELEYSAGLERMKDNGAHVLTTEIALFEWLKGAKHSKFKEVQMLIK